MLIAVWAMQIALALEKTNFRFLYKLHEVWPASATVPVGSVICVCLLLPPCTLAEHYSTSGKLHHHRTGTVTERCLS